MSSKFVDFRKCWRCGIELDAKSKHQEGSVGRWRSWLETGTAELGKQFVPSTEAFMALRAICHLFLRNRSRSQILKNSNQWSLLVSAMSPEAQVTQAIEQCSVSDRALLVLAAAELLEEWPLQFLSFATECRLQREHFSGCYRLMPNRMRQVVDTQLARQNRWVTAAVLSDTISLLATELGHSPSKTAVRQRLKWSGEKGLNAYFQKRTVATSAEWKDFVCAVNLMSQSVCDNPRSYRAFLLDMNILFYGISHQLSIAACQTVTLSIAIYSKELLVLDSSLINEELAIFRTLIDTDGAYSLNKAKWLESTVNPRQVRKRLTKLMNNFQPDLLREMLIFSAVSVQTY